MLLVWNDEGTAPGQRVFKVSWLNSPTRHKRARTREVRRDELINEYPGSPSVTRRMTNMIYPVVVSRWCVIWPEGR